MTNEAILAEVSGLLLEIIRAHYKWVLESMTAARQELEDERENTIIECKNLLLK